MTAPTVTVEIAFTSTFSTPEGARVWTDVTQYVEAQSALSIAFARTDERTQADANTLSLVFDNRDGRFTPERASSPYYPRVSLFRPVRITAQYSGGTARRRFTGYVTSWKQEWESSDAMATVALSASSRMKRLGQADVLRSVPEEEALFDDPTAFFTLSDPSGSVAAADSTPDVPLLGAMEITGPTSGVTFGADGGPATSPLSVASFTGDAQLYIAAPGPSGWTFEFLISTSDTPVSTGEIMNAFGGDALSVNSSGALLLNAGAVTGPVIGDGVWHHVALAWPGGTPTLYLDGVSLGSTAAGAYSSANVIIGPVGFAAKLANIAFINSTSAARIAERAEAALTGFSGETTQERAVRILGWRGIAIAEIDVVDTTRTIQHFETSGMSPLDAVRILESTEAGTLYDGKDGHTRLIGETSRYTAASAFTLDMAEQYVTVDFSPEYDDSQLQNDVTIESVDGSSSRAVSSASVATYGRAVGNDKTASTSATATAEDAAWVIARYAQPATRLASVTVAVHTLTDTVLREAVMAADVGTLLAISNLPAQFATTSGQWFIEGYSESFGVGTHYITFNLSAAAAYLATFILDDPVRGVLDAGIPLAH